MKIYQINENMWLKSIYMIQKLLPHDNFQESELLEWLNYGSGKVFGSFNNNSIIGIIFVCEYFQEKDKFVYIQSLCVDPNYRKLNIGSQLVSYICSKFLEIPIWAKISNNNLAAKILFRNIGFIQYSHKYTPYPLSKDYNSNYYPYVYQTVSSLWNMYAEECLLNNLIKNIEEKLK